MSTQIKEKQEKAVTTEIEIEEARKLYVPIGDHSALLFFIVSSMSNIDVMYQYSLNWFINLFIVALKNSEKNEFIEQRIEEVCNYFTFSIYSNVCRSLFEKDKLLFSFILAAKIEQSKG